MTEARAALRDVVSGIVQLVRTIPDPGVPCIGSWRAGDVAAHLSHVLRVDTDAIAERPLPSATITKAGADELTERLLAEDSQRIPAVLAERIDALFQEFDKIASQSRATLVTWLQGARIPPSAVACHLLEECLVHGHDMATATNKPWSIKRDHALLVIEGAVLPIANALPPTAFVNQERAQSFRVRIDLRLRGGNRNHVVITNGSLTWDPGVVSNVDVHVSADPGALLLVFMGRQGMWKPLLTGRAMAWGRRPWKLVRALGVLAPV